MDPLKKIWINTFARKRFYKFNDRLLRRGLVGLGVNDFGPRQEAGEKHLLKKLALVLPKNAVILDVGAHTGAYAHFLANLRPDFVIHAFEPNPVTYAKLINKIEGHFTPHQFALGDKEGELVLHDPKKGGGSECASLVASAVQELYHDQPQEQVKVQVKTLDHVMQTLSLNRVEYLKIDAEGYDLMVLQGAPESIKADRFGVIQFEFNTMNIFSRSFMHDFFQILPRHRMYRIVQDGLVPLGDYNPVTCELFGLQNIVALPHNMAGQIL